jgi:hypothetical protein
MSFEDYMNASYRYPIAHYARFFKLFVVCLGLAAIAGTPAARAQSAATGAVSGQVTDQQKAAVPGAAVRLTDLATSAVRTTTTNDAGRYEFVSIPPGQYDLTVSKTGFAQTKVNRQTVQVGLALTLDVELQVSATATTVEVTASAGAELQTMNATVGSTISGDSIGLKEWLLEVEIASLSKQKLALYAS